MPKKLGGIEHLGAAPRTPLSGMNWTFQAPSSAPLRAPTYPPCL